MKSLKLVILATMAFNLTAQADLLGACVSSADICTEYHSDNSGYKDSMKQACDDAGLKWQSTCPGQPYCRTSTGDLDSYSFNKNEHLDEEMLCGALGGDFLR